MMYERGSQAVLLSVAGGFEEDTIAVRDIPAKYIQPAPQPPRHPHPTTSHQRTA